MVLRGRPSEIPGISLREGTLDQMPGHALQVQISKRATCRGQQGLLMSLEQLRQFAFPGCETSALKARGTPHPVYLVIWLLQIVELLGGCQVF